MSHRFAIAIQARTGATRLPGKMSLSFFREKTILELIVDELKSTFPTDAILIATSTSPGDDEIEARARDWGVNCTRGSENDVLDRVWQGVRERELENVVRVCADNPFLRASFIESLLDAVEAPEKFDYLTYQLADGTPTILSHLGLFAEVIRFETLERIHATAKSQRHREHLTSHILDNPDQYRRKFLNVPDSVTRCDSLRLTVDTKSDFEVCQELYAAVHEVHGPKFTADQLVSVAVERSELLEKMSREIAANAKR